MEANRMMIHEQIPIANIDSDAEVRGGAFGNVPPLGEVITYADFVEERAYEERMLAREEGFPVPSPEYEAQKRGRLKEKIIANVLYGGSQKSYYFVAQPLL